MIDLGVKGDIDRIYTAMDSSRDAFRPFRSDRIEMIREFVGKEYGNNGATYDVLVNLLGMTADVYTIGLSSQNPKTKVTTTYRDLWPFAYLFQQGINNYLEEMEFCMTMQKVILDAFFTWGVVKVCNAEWKPIQLDDDVTADPGRPHVMHVSIDDFGLDMSVKDIRRCRFMWDEYRVSWQSVQDDPYFDKSVVRQMTPTSRYERDSNQAKEIASGGSIDDEEYEPMTDLFDVWLPESQQVATFPRHQQTKPLKVVDAGPEGGPYVVLSFAEVPDNVVPTTPAQNLVGLHRLYNGLIRKQARQAKRQKSNPVYNPSGAGDADNLRRYSDGEWVKVSDINSVGVVNQGGVDQGNVAFSQGVLSLFDRQAGNLAAMAGLGPQSNTVGQDELIHQAVSRKEAKMQQRVHAFTAKVLKKLGHLMWHDQFLEIPSNVELGNTGVFMDTTWSPEEREGDWWQYNFDIQPHSMEYESPQAKLEKMERALQQAKELYPILQQSGGSIDVQQVMRDYADLMGAPEFANWVTFASEPLIQRPGPEEGEVPKLPSTTTRNYVRRHVPGPEQPPGPEAQQFGGQQVQPGFASIGMG